MGLGDWRLEGWLVVGHLLLLLQKLAPFEDFLLLGRQLRLCGLKVTNGPIEVLHGKLEQGGEAMVLVVAVLFHKLVDGHVETRVQGSPPRGIHLVLKIVVSLG